MTISKDSYTVALKILEGRYQNKRLLVQEHTKVLLNLPTLSKSSHVQFRQLLDTVSNSLKYLKIFKVPVEQWDVILVQIILSRLDYISRREYELTLNDEIPKMSDLVEFLEKRCRTLESLSIGNESFNSRPDPFSKAKLTNRDDKPQQARDQEPNYGIKSFIRVSNAVSYKPACFYCNKHHPIYSCPEFLNLSPRQRYDFLKKKKLTTFAPTV